MPKSRRSTSDVPLMKHWSTDLSSLLRKMLSKDPSQRLTMSALMKHRWLQQANNWTHLNLNNKKTNTLVNVNLSYFSIFFHPMPRFKIHFSQVDLELILSLFWLQCEVFTILSATKKKKIRTATNCNILFNQTHNNAIKNTPTVATLALSIMPASKGTGFVVVISIGVITATRLGECLIIDDIMNTRSHTRCTVVLVTGIVKPNIAI